ncbi:hypothetical protein ACVIGA_008996 [Bradyrhizobium sp. USDA 3240]
MLAMDEPANSSSSPMEVATIGLDVSKHVFHIHAVDGQGQVACRQRLRPGEIVSFFSSLVPCLVAISMDGRGAWRDNVFVERLWRSVKYEEVYLRAYENVSEARASIGRYLDFYNRASEHPSVYVVEEKRVC